MDAKPIPTPRNEFEIVESDRLPDFRLFLVDLSHRNLHLHKEFELCLVLSGLAEVTVQKGSERFGAGDFFLVNPKQPHQIHAPAGQVVRILSLQVSPRFFEKVYPAIRSVEFDRPGIRPGAIAAQEAVAVADADAGIGASATGRLRADLLSLARAYFTSDPYYELDCTARLHTLFRLLLREVPWHRLSDEERSSKALRSDRLRRILEFVEAHATEKVLLSDIALKEDLSLAYLSHFFREHLDMTFQEYLTLLRYEEAKGLLERTDLSVFDIGVACGFSDGRYLRKAFQQRLSCAPEDYRQSIRRQPLSHFERTSGAVQRILGPEESLRYLAELDAGA